MKQIGIPTKPRIGMIILNIFIYSLPLIIIIVFFVTIPSAREMVQDEDNNDMPWLLMILFFLIYTFIILPVIFLYQMYKKASRNEKVHSIFKFLFMKLGFELDKIVELGDETHKSAVHEIKHERNMKDVLYYTEMAKANFYEAIGNVEQAKARLLLEAVKYLGDLPPRWYSYVVAALSGAKGTSTEDEDLQEEINRIKNEIELEELRKKKMENDERQRRQDANNKPPPDV